MLRDEIDKKIWDAIREFINTKHPKLVEDGRVLDDRIDYLGHEILQLVTGSLEKERDGMSDDYPAFMLLDEWRKNNIEGGSDD